MTVTKGSQASSSLGFSRRSFHLCAIRRLAMPCTEASTSRARFWATSTTCRVEPSASAGLARGLGVLTVRRVAARSVLPLPQRRSRVGAVATPAYLRR